ncbi:hypothetical protein IGI04_022598 [Brassica rapa subsp. trilocularis]|uniref:FBD domain-containing protein n=1 Tax=Brassica rapa subsp. trilocularis TaxID=1813537 RepID=A0ABQ7M426_BRACM|nr:hypothetical protein IGI04_022598 [Brassica rapa subsp. trilocularis]
MRCKNHLGCEIKCMLWMYHRGENDYVACLEHVLLKFFHIQISDHLTLKPTQPGAIACIHHLRTLNYKLLFNSSGCLFPLPP